MTKRGERYEAISSGSGGGSDSPSRRAPLAPERRSGKLAAPAGARPDRPDGFSPSVELSGDAVLGTSHASEERAAKRPAGGPANLTGDQPGVSGTAREARPQLNTASAQHTNPSWRRHPRTVPDDVAGEICVTEIEGNWRRLRWLTFEDALPYREVA